MGAPHKIYPHGALEALVPNLWVVDGALPIPLPRRMTVYRMPSGELLIYSAVALDEPGMKALEALGKPAILVVPHWMHLMDAPFYKARYPEMRVIAADDARARLGDRVRVHVGPEEGLEALGLRSVLVPGLKGTEVVLDLDVPGGRALVFTDIFGGWLERKGFMMRLLGAPGGIGVARIVRLRQVRDPAQVRVFFEALAERPDIRLLIPAHGDVIRERGRERLLEAAARL